MADPLVDLIDSTEANAYLTAEGLTAPANLATIITGVSAAMQAYCNRNFVSQAYTVMLSGNGGNRISLPNFPITAISALSVDGVAVPASSSPTTPGYAFTDTQLVLRGYRFCRGDLNVSLTYTGGFTPGTGSGQMPSDIRLACCEGISAVIASFQYNDPRAVEVKAGGSSIKLGTLADLAKLCLTPNVTSTLNQRARVAPC